MSHGSYKSYKSYGINAPSLLTGAFSWLYLLSVIGVVAVLTEIMFVQ